MFGDIVMDGIRNITSYSKVLQSYQDDGRVILKDSVQWNPVYGRKDVSLRRVSKPGKVDQQASALHSEILAFLSTE